MNRKGLAFVLTLIISVMTFAVTPQEAYKMSEAQKAVIVDVREFHEIASGMVRDAIWFPKSKMIKDSEALDSFRKVVSGKKVFLYCKSGRRASECQNVMKAHGIDAESIGGFDQLKGQLPTEGLHEKLLRLREGRCTQ